VELKLPLGQNVFTPLNEKQWGLFSPTDRVFFNVFTIMPEQHGWPFQENKFDRNHWSNLLVVTTAGFVILKIGRSLTGIT